MFRLPVCPHCKTVFHYRDVWKIKNKKTEKCYHCGKSFKVSRVGYLVLLLIVVLLSVVVNVMILSSMSNILSSIAPIIIFSLTVVVLALIFTPFFIIFKRINGR